MWRIRPHAVAVAHSRTSSAAAGAAALNSLSRTVAATPASLHCMRRFFASSAPPSQPSSRRGPPVTPSTTLALQGLLRQVQSGEADDSSSDMVDLLGPLASAIPSVDSSGGRGPTLVSAGGRPNRKQLALREEHLLREEAARRAREHNAGKAMLIERSRKLRLALEAQEAKEIKAVAKGKATGEDAMGAFNTAAAASRNIAATSFAARPASHSSPSPGTAAPAASALAKPSSSPSQPPTWMPRRPGAPSPFKAFDPFFDYGAALMANAAQVEQEKLQRRAMKKTTRTQKHQPGGEDGGELGRLMQQPDETAASFRAQAPSQTNDRQVSPMPARSGSAATNARVANAAAAAASPRPSSSPSAVPSAASARADGNSAAPAASAVSDEAAAAAAPTVPLPTSPQRVPRPRAAERAAAAAAESSANPEFLRHAAALDAAGRWGTGGQGKVPFVPAGSHIGTDKIKKKNAAEAAGASAVDDGAPVVPRRSFRRMLEDKALAERMAPASKPAEEWNHDEEAAPTFAEAAAPASSSSRASSSSAAAAAGKATGRARGPGSPVQAVTANKFPLDRFAAAEAVRREQEAAKRANEEAATAGARAKEQKERRDRQTIAKHATTLLEPDAEGKLPLQSEASTARAKAALPSHPALYLKHFLAKIHPDRFHTVNSSNDNGGSATSRHTDPEEMVRTNQDTVARFNSIVDYYKQLKSLPPSASKAIPQTPAMPPAPDSLRFYAYVKATTNNAAAAAAAAEAADDEDGDATQIPAAPPVPIASSASSSAAAADAPEVVQLFSASWNPSAFDRSNLPRLIGYIETLFMRLLLASEARGIDPSVRERWGVAMRARLLQHDLWSSGEEAASAAAAGYLSKDPTPNSLSSSPGRYQKDYLSFYSQSQEAHETIRRAQGWRGDAPELYRGPDGKGESPLSPLLEAMLRAQLVRFDSGLDMLQRLDCLQRLMKLLHGSNARSLYAHLWLGVRLHIGTGIPSYSSSSSSSSSSDDPSSSSDTPLECYRYSSAEWHLPWNFEQKLVHNMVRQYLHAFHSSDPATTPGAPIRLEQEHRFADLSLQRDAEEQQKTRSGNKKGSKKRGKQAAGGERA